MKKIIKGWKHLPGVHCGSVSLRDVVNYYNLPMSEPMCFGLGSGLGFFYTVDDNMSPSRNIHVRGPDMEPNFFSLFLDDASWKYDDNNESALKSLLYFLENDIPVILQTDIFHLQYYNSKTHFPGHVVVACGFDDSSDTVYLSDTGFEDLQIVSYQELTASRCSKAIPYPLSNNWMAVEGLNKRIRLEEAIPDAIQKNAENMLEGVTSSRGESGVESIKKLASDIPTWYLADDWKWSARYSYQVIQKRGTCGAGFRWMYRDFLNEAQQYIGSYNIHEIAREMDEIGKLWYGISNHFKELSELKTPDNSLEKLSSRIDELYKREKNYYTFVLNIISGANN